MFRRSTRREFLAQVGASAAGAALSCTPLAAGDGKSKPVAFPEPSSENTTGETLRVLSLKTLIELKLASGMTAPHRGQDLVDVMELIRVRGLSRDYAQALDEYVRAKYSEMWELAQVRDDY